MSHYRACMYVGQIIHLHDIAHVDTKLVHLGSILVFFLIHSQLAGAK